MMGDMKPTVRRAARCILQLILLSLAVGWCSPRVLAQVSYSVHMEMEKPTYLLGEPIFCRFVIRNTGSTLFAFHYRTPTRALTSDYNQEPRFLVSDARGQRLPDPGPRPCGQDGQHVARAEKAEVEAAAGQFEDQPRLGHALGHGAR